ncbi:heme ABC transporter permease [Commensalibacter oyaizuii]|uniref:Heme exporter protein C n=1 Tax=Commensalibacter oyaizuii TaxID=3043873 RepID=A0ABT6PY99_9PROT|nr:heme ABC transporter permease [Commensalibacter sp. TBRC 16381]MDI2089833.1 heme ABC transporter permease [Commensalibacter sp. TBRC 16381]
MILSIPSKKSFRFIVNRLANPGVFLRFTTKAQPWVTTSALIISLIGIIGGLFFAPADWQQGDSVRIMYLHVPMAILASGGYFALAICALLSLIWRHPLADLAAAEISPIGATITALCLITGSLWGKPMWGTWWVWDARLTSVLVLFFLYLGHITLLHAFDDQQKGYKAAAILALVGVFDLPIIKFSVNWWNTLHQPSTFSFTHASSITLSMMWPLFFCIIGFALGFVALVFYRLRAAIIEHQIRHLLISSTQDDRI